MRRPAYFDRLLVFCKLTLLQRNDFGLFHELVAKPQQDEHGQADVGDENAVPVDGVASECAVVLPDNNEGAKNEGEHRSERIPFGPVS